jgi:uncharacterized SAM-binding protein YcdF (DUF218 family)/glycosyltransferase involved in cell wall biosynthesis
MRPPVPFVPAEPESVRPDQLALEGEDLICFSSIDWDFNWQGHQEVMAALAAHGNRVLFVENTGVRAAAWRDLPRLRHRLRNWWRSTKGFRQERDNLFVYSPVLLPFPHLVLARFLNRVLLGRALERWMRATRFQRPLIWTFLPTPLVVDLIDRLPQELVVYYCIADFEQLSSHARLIRRSERKLLERTDVVFAQGDELRDRCSPHPNIHIFPFGVSLRTFRRAGEMATELEALRRPVVGYVGALHRHLDLDLVVRIAREIDGTVVLVGPTYTDLTPLKKVSNVVLIGPQPHERVPEFVRGFDVALIPYVLNEHTVTVYPTKLNEYLALGMPVVATDLPELRRFNERFGNVVEVTEGDDAFVAAVRKALARPSTSEEIHRRVACATHNGWEARIARMAEIAQAALVARRAERGAWQQVLRRIYRVARRRAALSATLVLAAFLMLFYTNAVWIVAAPLRVEVPPRAADAVVVFAGGVGESGRAGGGYQERVKQAVDLYQAGLAPRLVFSSGFTFTFREAEVMRELASDLGVPLDAIVLEEEAGNTYENVRNVQAILERQGWDQVLLVSSPYHMRRALLIWEQVAPQVEILPSPVPRSQFYSHSRGASVEQIRGIVHEYAAIVAYWWRGWI